MLKKVCSCLAVLLIASATVMAGNVELEGVKCVVANKAASEGKSADFKGGKVYFCCGGCAGKFASNTKKFTANANHQLVATKQFEQKACPFSGGDVDPSKTTMVAGTKVGFCCDGCKNKVESAKDDAAKMKLVFNDKTFAKGFKKKSAE
ncbi:MAG: hypothetical protein AB8B91_03770 [Rubripirellula sp.]